jgi:3-keto-disaccharide hydrolase
MSRKPVLFAVAATLLFAANASAADKDGWVSLFDGKSLKGWKQRNGTAKYRAEKGAIVGKTNEGSPNSFLCTLKNYGDFELTFEVKVANELNSGVQIRSASTKSFNNYRVHGPQVEISTDGKAGFIYGEALGTGWISDEAKVNKLTKAFKNGQWNKYRVLAKGKSIKTWINGVPIADTIDNKSKMKSGFIGLQVHGIAKGTGPYEVRWRNIKLRELSK